MRLKEIRRQFGLSQLELAKRLRVSRSTIAMWETGGSNPDNEALMRISSIFDVSVDYLLGREGQKNNAASNGSVKVPVLGDVRAGLPMEAVENILDYEEISPDMAAHGDYFALRIRGDSMEPRIHEGDVVIVRRQPDVDSGDLAIVLVNGDSATIKRVRKLSDGIMLIPLNPSYEPIYYDVSTCASLPVQILGRVVELRAKF